MPFVSTSWGRVSKAGQGGDVAQKGWATNLPDLLGLRVPLGAVLVVLDWPELAKQEKYLCDDDAGEVLGRGGRRVGRGAGRAGGARD